MVRGCVLHSSPSHSQLIQHSRGGCGGQKRKQICLAAAKQVCSAARAAVAASHGVLGPGGCGTPSPLAPSLPVKTRVRETPSPTPTYKFRVLNKLFIQCTSKFNVKRRPYRGDIAHEPSPAGFGPHVGLLVSLSLRAGDRDPEGVYTLF